MAAYDSGAGLSRKPPRRSILTDEVYEATKARILDHLIAPEARIYIDALAQDLNVSPTPVREALARLESEGLVVKEALRGYRATALLTREELKDLYDFRLLIEPWGASRAAARATVDDIAAIAAEMATINEETASNYRVMTEHDTRFHTLIAELSGSAQLLQAFSRMHAHLHIFRLRHVHSVSEVPLDEHREIAAAVSAGDSEAAAAAMRKHLVNSITQRLNSHGERG